MLRKVFQASCLAVVLVVSLGAAPGLARAQENLPTLGRGTTGLSKLDEDKLGWQFMLKARQTLDFIDDPELTEYINKLGHRLSSHSDEPKDTFHFYLAKSSDLNAFAVPGGYVVVYTGLLMATETEPELAAVMAHEIAHITQHHLSRMVEDTKGQGFKMLGALVAAILFGAQAGTAAVLGTEANGISDQLRYQRGFEQEADARGIQTMVKAGYDPRAMVRFFEILERWTRVAGSNVPEFLRDHPLTAKRIADAKERADQYPVPPPPDETDFYHVRAKIRAMYSADPEATAQRFAAKLKSGKYESEASERYGYALALSRAGRYHRAIQVIDKLVARYPHSLWYQSARGNILMDAGRYDDALKDFASSHKEWPNSRSLDIYYATALIQTKHYEEAKELLKARLLTHQKDAPLYSLLARTEGEMGNSLVAHQDLAEYYYLRQNLQKAYRQLKLAEKYIDGSEYAKASIDARMKDVRHAMQIYGQKPGEGQTDRD